MNGWWFIFGNVVRELLAFNKIEILPWDHEVGLFTHRLEDPLPAEGPELAEYDRLASLVAVGDPPAFLASHGTCIPASLGCTCRQHGSSRRQAPAIQNKGAKRNLEVWGGAKRRPNLQISFRLSAPLLC